MFIDKINGEDCAIDQINKKWLTKLYKKYPFVFNSQKRFLWDYIKIKEVEDLLFEVSFYKFLTLQEKCLAYLMLSTLITKYNLKVVGIGITIEVNDRFKKDLGDTCIERLVFPHPTNIWDFAPDRGPAVLDVPGELCEKINFLERGEYKSYSADYFTVEMKTDKVYSLIIS